MFAGIFLDFQSDLEYNIRMRKTNKVFFARSHWFGSTLSRCWLSFISGCWSVGSGMSRSWSRRRCYSRLRWEKLIKHLFLIAWACRNAGLITSQNLYNILWCLVTTQIVYLLPGQADWHCRLAASTPNHMTGFREKKNEKIKQILRRI